MTKDYWKEPFEDTCQFCGKKGLCVLEMVSATTGATCLECKEKRE